MAVSSASWLQIISGASGTGNGTIGYTYSDNPSTDARTATITVGTHVFTVTQAGAQAPCTVRLSPTSADFTGDGGTGSIAVTAACTWKATPSASWITITDTGSSTVSYRVAVNATTQSRVGTIVVADQTFTITQAATTLPVITAVTNSASFVKDSASPGAVVAVFGSRLGPADF